jgi:hypothetical protein
LFSLSTIDASGFNGDLTPFNSTQLFTLFAEAMQNVGLWQRSESSLVFIGSGDNVLSLGDLEWSLVSVRPGDFDFDGNTAGRDFLAWQRNPDVGNIADWQRVYGMKLGDFDFDGDSDGHDLLVWQRNFNRGGIAVWQADYGTKAGDFDLDGDSDGRDFLLWQRGKSPKPLSAGDMADWQAIYGTVSELAARQLSVPEPGAAVLTMITAVITTFIAQFSSCSIPVRRQSMSRRLSSP